MRSETDGLAKVPKRAVFIMALKGQLPIHVIVKQGCLPVELLGCARCRGHSTGTHTGPPQPECRRFLFAGSAGAPCLSCVSTENSM
jgi:hypothetical protein